MSSSLSIGPKREPQNGADPGLPGTEICCYAFPRSHCKPNQSKDVKRACACDIQPFVVINGLFYSSSSRLGSALHSEGLKVSPSALLLLTVVALALFTLTSTFHSCPTEARNSSDKAFDTLDCVRSASLQDRLRLSHAQSS